MNIKQRITNSAKLFHENIFLTPQQSANDYVLFINKHPLTKIEHSNINKNYLV